MQRVAVVLMGLFAASLLVASACGDGAGGELRTETNATLKEGDAAPAFSLPGAGGETVSLAQFRGSSVLLYFSMGHG